MITITTIYWLTRLPYLNGFCFDIGMIGFFIFLITSVMYFAMKFDDGFKGNQKSLIPIIFTALILTLLGSFGVILIPSDMKEIAAIYLLPSIANNKDAKEIPENTFKLLNSKLKIWMKENIDSKTKR